MNREFEESVRERIDARVGAALGRGIDRWWELPHDGRMKTVDDTQIDGRPRFGWCADLDNEPQVITESSDENSRKHFVAVVPLPYNSSKLRKEIREFVKSRIWPKD